MKVLTVRDPQSAKMLRDAGVSAPVIESADLSYLMALPETSQQEPRKKPVLGIAVSQPFKGILHQDYPGFERRVLAALADLADEFDIHFYSFDIRNEGALADEWTGPHSRSVYDPQRPGAVERFLRAIGESDILLTSRLHGVILSARMGIPFVSIGAPGEKIEREASALESPFNLFYSAESGEIVKAVRDAWSDRKHTSSRLAQAVSRQEARAQMSIEALKENTQ
jgi:polysaccharide pyruvyl transferase WcaK-like protein